MDGSNGELMENNQESNSFGIKKIVDVKLSEDGIQMYKVQWEPTWEPVQNLVSCQHLIDEFWSCVNKAKVNVKNEEERVTYTNLDVNSEEDFPKISDDDKSEVQRLIARTNATFVPSNLSLNQQDKKIGSSFVNFQNDSEYSPSKSKQITVKNEVSSAGGKEKVTISSLKHIENFENPYVKIILVCKICNKEQSLKLARNWKRHYLSHASNEEKPHQCPHCPKAFITLTQKTKHLKTHENGPKQKKVKQEQTSFDSEKQGIKQEPDMFHTQQQQQQQQQQHQQQQMTGKSEYPLFSTQQQQHVKQEQDMYYMQQQNNMKHAILNMQQQQVGKEENFYPMYPMY